MIFSQIYVKKIYDINISDDSHLIPHHDIKIPDSNETFPDQVNLDPDNQEN